MLQVRRRRVVVPGGIGADLPVDGDEPPGSHGFERVNG